MAALVRSCERLVTPYISPILRVLMNKLRRPEDGKGSASTRGTASRGRFIGGCFGPRNGETHQSGKIVELAADGRRPIGRLESADDFERRRQIRAPGGQSNRPIDRARPRRQPIRDRRVSKPSSRAPRTSSASARRLRYSDDRRARAGWRRGRRLVHSAAARAHHRRRARGQHQGRRHRDHGPAHREHRLCHTPFNEHPGLLSLMLRVLAEETGPVRAELLRTLGVLGALDPHAHRENEERIHGQGLLSMEGFAASGGAAGETKSRRSCSPRLSTRREPPSGAGFPVWTATTYSPRET